VEFKFRKKLLDLVEKKGLSVAAACRQMNVSPKPTTDSKDGSGQGPGSLKPMKSERKGAGIRELSVPQRDALMALVCKNPDWDPTTFPSLRKNSPS